MLGNEDGGFCEPISYFIEIYNNESITFNVFDFNNDNQPDIVLIAQSFRFISVLLGNDDGTFKPEIFATTFEPLIPNGFVFIDLDHDSCLDIAVVTNFPPRVHITFGNTNGTFSEEIALICEDMFPRSIVVADFNNDNYLDIVVDDERNRHFGVFFGYGNRSFGIQKKSVITRHISPIYMVVGDFNEDTRPDIVFIDFLEMAIGIVFGYGDGNFSETTVL